MSVIYAIINIVNDKHYVGQASDKIKRFKEHVKCLKGGYHFNRHLQRSYLNYGLDNFIFIVLEKCNLTELDEREQYWIDLLNPEYNIAPVAGSMLNYKHTNEARANMSKAQLGKKHSEETRRKRAASLIGNKNSVGADKTIQIEAMRIATKGNPKSAEHRAKIAKGNRGKIISDETKRKMSEAAKRRWNTA